ncbi:alpha-L-rhamnosidase C-terminal domain-containing protein [Streptomyces sp. NPDC059629]
MPGGDLTWAKAAHLTPYGRAEAGWRVEEPGEPSAPGGASW